MPLTTNNSDIIKVSGPPNLSAKNNAFLHFFRLTKLDLHVMKNYLQPNSKTAVSVTEEQTRQCCSKKLLLLTQ